MKSILDTREEQQESFWREAYEAEGKERETVFTVYTLELLTSYHVLLNSLGLPEWLTVFAILFAIIYSFEESFSL